MTIHQLSLFLENKPGKTLEHCRILAQAGVNIRTLTLAFNKSMAFFAFVSMSSPYNNSISLNQYLL